MPQKRIFEVGWDAVEITFQVVLLLVHLLLLETYAQQSGAADPLGVIYLFMSNNCTQIKIGLKNTKYSLMPCAAIWEQENCYCDRLWI